MFIHTPKTLGLIADINRNLDRLEETERKIDETFSKLIYGLKPGMIGKLNRLIYKRDRLTP